MSRKSGFVKIKTLIFGIPGEENLTDLLRSAVYKRQSYENLFVTRKWRENLESLQSGGRNFLPTSVPTDESFPTRRIHFQDAPTLSKVHFR